jgi:hypothetical protein
MKKLSITKAGFTAFTNAMHVELHTKILAYIDTATVDALGLDSATVDAYRASIAKEQTYVNHSYSSLLTPEIVKARAKRDSWYRYVRGTMEVAQYSPASDVVTAYGIVYLKLLKVYPALSAMADGQAATVQIRGFIATAQDECASQVEKLGLSTALMMLQSSNDDYASKYIQRNTERAEFVPSEMSTARTTTDSLYRTLSYGLQGQALLTSTDTEKQAVYTQCADAVAKIGVLLGDWQYRLRLSRKEAVVAPTVGSSEDAAGDTGNTTGNTDAATPDDEDAEGQELVAPEAA